MKITGVEAIPLAIPYKKLDPPSPWLDAARKQILVRVTTDEGLVGWGEAFALGAPLAVCSVVEESLRPLLLGESPTDLERLTDRLHRATMLFGRRGLAMFAISGVDLALWDLAGKARALPVFELLGGRVQPRIPAYASLLWYERSEEVHAAARQTAAQGFRAVKLHQTDAPSALAARDAVGPAVELMLDVNCPWSPAEAIRIARTLEECGLAWLEEPVWPPEDYRGLAEVRAALRMPIAAGENEATLFGFRELIAQGAVDILQPSVTKVGGLSEARKICTLAAAWNVAVVPHSFYFGPGLAATLHLIAATPGIRYVEYPGGELETPILTEPIVAHDGWVAVPTAPGLGVSVNEEAVRRHPYTAGSTRPFTTGSR